MFVMIDNYDSFVFNLVTYFRELGAEMRVVRSSHIPFHELDTLLAKGELEGIVISPGPKSPAECAFCIEVVHRYGAYVPLLGVCLGHQVIAAAFCGQVTRAATPMHGKLARIFHKAEGLFAGLPQGFKATRYHSLVVEEHTLPDCFSVDAKAEDGAIMAISHCTLPIYGIQYHPEAVLTQYGHELLANFLQICAQWQAGAMNFESRVSA